MRRPGRFLVLCLLLVLLPLRSVLAAAQLECGPAQPAPAVMAPAEHAHHDHQHMDDPADAHHSQACKLCAPCCLAAAPPPALALTVTSAPAQRAAQVPAERWTGVVPPLPDPPPRA